MKELIHYIATALVDDKEAVTVSLSSEDDTCYELHVAPDDRGKVIGRKGRTAHAIRTLLEAACDPGDVKPSLEILD
ncbi:MAG: KH domain-containing protein [Myxococcota bacterium]|nr:KH domain-containing protein [Myxococcota bacterium]